MNVPTIIGKKPIEILDVTIKWTRDSLDLVKNIIQKSFFSVLVKYMAYKIWNYKQEISVIEFISLLQKINHKKLNSKKINYPESYPEDEPQRRCPEISKVKKDLNYFLKNKLEDGLRNYLKWGKNNYKIYKRN